MKKRVLLAGLCVIAGVGVIAVAATDPASAAVLRRMTTLQGPQVYLRDLFDDAGANADRVLGPGPGPGGRIVVEARQLKAIAQQYDVDWQPASGNDRAMLEWPGRPMKREDALAALRTALIAEGAAPDCDVEIPGFNPPIVPLAGVFTPVVTRLDYDRDMGRFVAFLSVTGDGTEPVSVRVSGEVSDVIELPVTVIRLSAGAIAGPDDVRMARIHVASVHGEVARELTNVVGMQLKQQIPAGVPIPVAELMQPTQITRGEPVRLQLQVAGLSLSGQGTALESGSIGDQIRVRNISSQAILEAEVLGPGVVRVVPGSAPIVSQARAGINLARGG
jgi:flagella basal body P-ring formation protein FlgA